MDLVKGKLIVTEKVMVAVLMNGSSIVYIDSGVTMQEPTIIKLVESKNKKEVGITFDPLLKFGEAESCEGFNTNCILVKYPAAQEVATGYLQFCKQLKAQRAGLIAPGM